MRALDIDRVVARLTWALFGLYGPLGFVGLAVALVRHPGLVRATTRALLTSTVHAAIIVTAIAAAFAVLPSVASETSRVQEIRSRNAVLLSESAGTWSSALPVASRVAPPAPVAALAGARPVADCVVVPAGRALAHTVQTARLGERVTASLYLRSAPAASAAAIRFIARASGVETAATVTPTPTWERHARTVGGGPHRQASIVLYNPGPDALEVCVTGVQVQPGHTAGDYVNLVSAAQDLGRGGAERLLAALLTAAVLYGLVAGLAAARALTLAADLPLERLVPWLAPGLVVHVVLVAIRLVADPGRASGLTAHANVLGASAGLAAVLLATVGRPTRLRAAGLAAAVLLVLASQSRLATIGLGLVVVVALARTGGRRAAWLGAGLAALSIGAVVLSRGVSPDWLAATGRPAIFVAAFEAWTSSARAFLFGWGSGGTPIGLALAMWPDGTRFFGHTHNVLLQLAVQMGAIGAAGLVVGSVALARRTTPFRASDAAVVGFLVVVSSVDLTVVASPVYALLLGYAGARLAQRSLERS